MTSPSTIHLAHSPDSDDAFMFYALADGQIDTQGISYVHELQDIETLNGRALRGELDVTAVSIHAYAYLSELYALLPHGASMGDGYGPMLVAKHPMTHEDIAGKRVAVPGMMTSAYLALKLFQPDFVPVVVPFDQIEQAVIRGDVDAGLLIHEGQLTYKEKLPFSAACSAPEACASATSSHPPTNGKFKPFPSPPCAGSWGSDAP